VRRAITVTVTNAQRQAPVSASWIMRLARRAIRRLRIRTPGTLAITFIGPGRMRTLNRRFKRHDWTTDVLSFRYDGPSTRPVGGGARSGFRPLGLHEQIVGEVLINPSAARAYARRHGIPYDEELSRYVVHGLLHWLGHEDRTRAQQQKMRAMEDRLLSSR
jgi:probable rRNA maturation factor